MHRVQSLALVIGVAGCATTSSTSLPVERAVREASQRNGQLVQVEGFVGSWHNGVNLFSPSRRECIGLLVRDTDVVRFRAIDGRRVTVRGKLEAQGCGYDGICDEHLCGPAVLSLVQLEE
jgi:hypothetical protein